MKRDYEYWERAYFEGWLGKLILAALIGLCVFIIIKNHIEPNIVQTVQRNKLIRRRERRAIERRTEHMITATLNKPAVAQSSAGEAEANLTDVLERG